MRSVSNHSTNLVRGEGTTRSGGAFSCSASTATIDRLPGARGVHPKRVLGTRREAIQRGGTGCLGVRKSRIWRRATAGRRARAKWWSAQRKAEVVLRLLRGEDIGEVSREIRIALPELERWREFLEGGSRVSRRRTGREAR